MREVRAREGRRERGREDERKGEKDEIRKKIWILGMRMSVHWWWV